MNRSVLGKTTALAACMVAGLLFLQSVRLQTAVPVAGAHRFSEKVNLALRRTAHFLLTEAGDSTTRIQPVEQVDSSTWMIRIERHFNYDRLPVLLQESLGREGISGGYEVAIFDCEGLQLQLGYTQIDLSDKNGVPCGGRSTDLECVLLQVTFANAPVSGIANGWWFFAGGIFLLGLSFGAWRWSVRNRPMPPAASDQASLQLGNSTLDVANQILVSGGATHKLTYREAKLLHLFVSRPNQLLERDFILKSVWEDEGIIVGRSVDVFVSRLRKMLKEDSALKLVAVHGVGYRLEVEAS
jgi:hypothetical protein